MKKILKFAHGAVNMAVLAAILLVLAFGCYCLWDSRQIYAAAAPARYEKYKPAHGEQLPFEALQLVNPEVVAWLTVYGTHIDYPVAQGQDNLWYINRDILGKHSLSGAIFLDADCGGDFADFNSILHGHHMAKNAMFGDIGLFADRAYFGARRYGCLYYAGREHGLEFFAFVHTSAYDASLYRTGIAGETQRQAYLRLLLRAAMHTRAGVSVGAGERIVLLSTCSSSSTNGRDILVGKITDAVHADPFQTAAAAAQADTLARMPVWCLAALGALLLVLPAALLVYFARKKKKRLLSRGKRDFAEALKAGEEDEDWQDEV